MCLCFGCFFAMIDTGFSCKPLTPMVTGAINEEAEADDCGGCCSKAAAVDCSFIDPDWGIETLGTVLLSCAAERRCKHGLSKRGLHMVHGATVFSDRVGNSDSVGEV